MVSMNWGTVYEQQLISEGLPRSNATINEIVKNPANVYMSKHIIIFIL